MENGNYCPNGHPLSSNDPVCALCTTLPRPTRPSPTPPPDIPGYIILDELGRGGMGVVFRASQVRLNRLVALKMIRAGAHAEADQLARFRAEAEAVARVQHPSIVQIYEVGEHEGLPFLSLELVDGHSLAERLGGTPQSPLQAAHLLEVVARAIDTVHQAGIVHRDLKPANILLAHAGCKPPETTNGAADTHLTLDEPAAPLPLDQYLPKITDFGLAKQLKAPHSQTASGAVIGTPAYMAPEQAYGKSRVRPVGPPADIYALGAILYEMLTGSPPFRGEQLLDILDQIWSREPVPPTRLQPKVPRDLETICLKCLEKDPRKRYASAAALADDLRCFLDGKPITARPVGLAERGWRWCRRNPWVAAWIAAFVISLLVGSGMSLSFALEANTRAEEAMQSAKEKASETRKVEEKAANERKAKAELQKTAEDLQKTLNRLKLAAENEARARLESEQRNQQILRQKRIYNHLFYASILKDAQTDWEDANINNLLALLDDLRPEHTSGEDLRGFEWFYWWQLCHADRFTLYAHSGGVTALAFSPNGDRLASAGSKVGEPPTGTKASEIKVWNTATGQLLLTFKKHTAEITALAFSPDGKYLASASHDGTVKVWEAANGAVLHTLEDHGGGATAVVFSPDGGRLASASHGGGKNGEIHLWDLRNGQKLRSFKEHKGAITSIAFRPNSKHLASASSAGADSTVCLWDTDTGATLLTIPGPGAFLAVAFSSNGKRLAIGAADRTISLWDPNVPRRLVTLEGHADRVTSLAFHPNGKQLVSASEDRTVIVWDPEQRQRLLTLKGHRRGITAVLFSTDGRRLTSASADGTVRVWDAKTSPEALILEDLRDPVARVAFSPDGRWLATAGSGVTRNGAAIPGFIKIWNAATGKLERTLDGHELGVTGLVFSPDGKRLASSSLDKTVKVWDPRVERALLTFDKHPAAVWALAFSPDGQVLATASSDLKKQGEIKFWNVSTGLPAREDLRGHANPVSSLAFSGDGKLLASGSFDGTVLIWDLDSRRKPYLLTECPGEVRELAFSPLGDGKYHLAIACKDQTLRVWDVRSRQEVLALKRHSKPLTSVVFSPNGKRLVSGAEDRTVKVWDAVTGREVLTLRGHTDSVMGVALSATDLYLASTAKDGTVRIWGAGTGQGAVSRAYRQLHRRAFSLSGGS
jgi:WD40 repeat protein/serine/threonine protein kinase